MRSIRFIAPLLASLIAAPLLAQAAPASVATVADYTVFVDAPTGFVFVKLPQGWKFAGKSDAALPSRLPANVVTRLLPAETDSTLAANQQLATSSQP